MVIETKVSLPQPGSHVEQDGDLGIGRTDVGRALGHEPAPAQGASSVLGAATSTTTWVIWPPLAWISSRAAGERPTSSFRLTFCGPGGGAGIEPDSADRDTPPEQPVRKNPADGCRSAHGCSPPG